MLDLLRESAIGQLTRFVTGDKFFRYPEEEPDFVLPDAWADVLSRGEKPQSSQHVSQENTSGSSDDNSLKHELTRSIKNESHHSMTLNRTHSRMESQSFTNDRLDTDLHLALERTKTIPIVPQRTADGNVLVDWYTTDDRANPHNWSNSKRFLVSFIICLYTFTVYMGSAIYTSGIGGVIEQFGVTPLDGSLPLSLYVLAYGMGPLLFSPLSEIASIGRNPVYIITMFLFVIISIPTALVKNFAGLLVLRYMQGFFGSPCLATGAATMQDMYSLLNLPYAVMFWVSAAYCGPAIGPLLSGYAVMAKGWRWGLWEILWAAGPVFILMFLCLPETSEANILLRRAQRLRKRFGDDRLQSQSELNQRNVKPMIVAWDALIKPFEITLKDPAILFVNVYTAIIYGIYYSFFEVFPLVYIDLKGFTIGSLGVLFTCILVACIIAMFTYAAYLRWYLIPDIMKNGLRAQEHRLVPALVACFGPPVGLFIFGWTATSNIPWIAPTIGIVIYGSSVYIVMQCIFVYVPLSYPQVSILSEWMRR